jgi:hypothetical protein
MPTQSWTATEPTRRTRDRSMSEALTPSSSNPPVDPLADRLRRAIAHAFHARTDHDVTDELRDAVCAFVRGQREAGTRIEEVVIAVKAAVDLADLRPIRTIERRELTERVVTWCISEYYRGD